MEPVPAKAWMAVILLGTALALGACAAPERAPTPLERRADSPTPDANFTLWQDCTLAQAQQWEAGAVSDAMDAMRAASCYAVLYVKAKAEEKDDSESIDIEFDDPAGGPSPSALARSGRAAAKAAAATYLESGLAHYLYAYLTGLAAESNPFQGLDLVPVMEQEALLAAELDPMVDEAGSDRLLSQLYLQAPGPPMSVGDLGKSLEHGRKAVELAPGFAENRLTLAQALLADEEGAGACAELRQGLASLEPEPSGGVVNDSRRVWGNMLEFLDKICETM